MDNQGITAEQARMMQMQAAQQSGGLSGLGGGLFGGIASGFEGAFPSPSFGGSLVFRSTQESEAAMAIAVPDITRKPGRPPKIKDYSEHLTRKEEKILPIEKR